jgi:hypothetical protein
MGFAMHFNRRLSGTLRAPGRGGREPLGGGFILSSGAKHMLRALTPYVDADGVFAGTLADAARIARVDFEAAKSAINELGSRGMIHARWRTRK